MSSFRSKMPFNETYLPISWFANKKWYIFVQKWFEIEKKWWSSLFLFCKTLSGSLLLVLFVLELGLRMTWVSVVSSIFDFFYLCFLILAGFLADSCRIYVRFLKDFGRILEKIFSSCLLSLIVSVNACDYVDFCIFKVFFFTSLFLFHEPLSDASFSSDRQRCRGR